MSVRFANNLWINWREKLLYARVNRARTCFVLCCCFAELFRLFRGFFDVDWSLLVWNFAIVVWLRRSMCLSIDLSILLSIILTAWSGRINSDSLYDCNKTLISRVQSSTEILCNHAIVYLFDTLYRYKIKVQSSSTFGSCIIWFYKHYFCTCFI